MLYTNAYVPKLESEMRGKFWAISEAILFLALSTPVLATGTGPGLGLVSGKNAELNSAGLALIASNGGSGSSITDISSQLAWGSNVAGVGCSLN
jgi:hypothetical protein